MEPEIDTNLERLIHEELRKLPAVKAPESLSARVLATVHARESLPWWRQSIWNWPAYARTAFLITLAVAVAGITGTTWLAGDVAAKGADLFGQVTDVIAPLSNAFLVLWKAVLQNVVLFGLAFTGMLYLVCVGAGTMFVRLAVRRS